MKALSELHRDPLCPFRGGLSVAVACIALMLVLARPAGAAIASTTADPQPTTSGTEAREASTGSEKPREGSPDDADEAAPSKKEFNLGKPKVYGFVQFHYRHAFETGNDGVVDNANFRVQRARIGVKGDIAPRISYEIEVDPRAPEVTGILRDAFIRLEAIPNHQIRLGQQKTRFGYENNVSSSELFAVNRTEISDNLSRGPNLRDLGVGLIGHIPLSDTVRLEDALTVVNGAGMNVQDDDTSRKSIWGRLGLRHKRGAAWERLGVSAATGDFIDPGDDLIDLTDDVYIDFDRVGVDLEINRKWFFLSAEYVKGTDNTEAQELVEPMGEEGEEGEGEEGEEEEEEEGTAQMTSLRAPSGMEVMEATPELVSVFERVETDGFYVSLVGKTRRDIGPMARYDVFGDDYRRWTFGAYFGDPKANFRVLVNYELRQKMESSTGEIGRGDDKLYLWTQVKF